MRAIVLAASLAIVSFPGLAAAQSYADLGHALYARGYTGSVWVNSFDPTQAHLAHGVFYPDVPIGPTGYDLRYGMAVTGSGTVSVGTDGFYMATGTATNPNAVVSDGSISIDLLSNGNVIDSGKVPFNCGASATCAWTVHFITRPTVANLTVRVYRHVEGSVCGGELSIDLNGTCHDNLVNYFNLPSTYLFTSTDNLDTNYAAKPGANTSALCAVILPVCSTTPAVPVSNFTWSPSDVYVGAAVNFTDLSTGSPTGWSWTFQNGTPATARTANPGVTFGSAGAKTVTLTASNAQGTGSLATKTIVVLDPNPAGTVTASAASVTQCQAETFTANVTGAPPLTYSWRVLDPNGATVNPPGVVAGSSTFAWTSLPSLAPGTYTGEVTVKNSFNTNGVVLRQAVQLAALPALTDISGAAPTTNGFAANVVLFTAPVFNGATQVVWDYGDGHSDTFTDPVAGRSPSHTYAAVGTYHAKVTISNCVNPGGSTSQPVSVVISQTAVLAASFQPSLFCQFGQCFATAGIPIVFVDASTGAEFWDYDWDHTDLGTQTCNFTDTDHTSPVATHTYTSAGTFVPCLRVRRGAGEQSVVAPTVVSVGSSTQQPAITVTGPSSGQVNQAYSFSASASNCTPNSAGWTWNVTGGAIAGSSTGSSISVSWSSAGTKTVVATNTGCSGAQGSTSIALTGTDGSTVAAFTVSPASPKAGDTVTFDSSPSTGVPAGATIGWSFGDSSPATSGSHVTHVYANAGNYNVQLTITPAGCLSTTCLSTAAKTVTVAPAGTGTTAQFTVSPASPKAGDTVTFDSSPSTGVPAGASIGWSFGDGRPDGSGTAVIHVYASAGSYEVVLTITPAGCLSTACLSMAAKTVTVAPADTGGGGGAQFTVSPAAPTSGDPVTFDASASTNIAAGSLFGWTFGDGSATSFGTIVLHTFAAPGTYNVALGITPPGCTAASCLVLASKTVVVSQGNGVHFTVSPASPSATQAATFDASSSTNVAAGSLFGWDFGDGSATGFGTIILHAFPAAGTYNVVLAIAPPGCTVASCLKLASRAVVVGPAPPVSADFSSDGSCTNDQCQAQATTPVTLTATAADATTYAWDFGDGANGAGRQVTHAWAQAGTYAVSLTAVKGAAAATKTRNFVVSPAPPPQTKTTLLPLATESRGVLVQSNDLYVYNPGSSPLDIAVEFRKRGTPDVNPPRVTTTLQPGASLYAPDMLSSLFNLANVAGFITVVTGIDKAEPVVTSFNSQGATVSKQFGLTIPGSSVRSLGGAPSQFLVGLHDSPDRQSSFGFSNPTDETATYHLRFFDKTGRLL
ncbi:MAG: PKD domain-containing protein, partial [Thermoanaerobaculia bacterium]